MYRPYNCHDCGAALAVREVAAEYARTVVSPRNANKQVGPTRRYCAECHAVNCWKTEQNVRAHQAEVLASLSPEERARYEERKAAR